MRKLLLPRLLRLLLLPLLRLLLLPLVLLQLLRIPLLLLLLLLRLPLLLVQQRLPLLLPLLPLPLLQLSRLTVGETDRLIYLCLVDLARPAYIGLQPGYIGLQPGRSRTWGCSVCAHRPLLHRPRTACFGRALPRA